MPSSPHTFIVGTARVPSQLLFVKPIYHLCKAPALLVQKPCIVIVKPLRRTKFMGTLTEHNNKTIGGTALLPSQQHIKKEGRHTLVVQIKTMWGDEDIALPICQQHRSRRDGTSAVPIIIAMGRQEGRSSYWFSLRWTDRSVVPPIDFLCDGPTGVSSLPLTNYVKSGRG